MLFLKHPVSSFLRVFALDVLSAWKILDIHVAHFPSAGIFLLYVSSSESPPLDNLFKADTHTLYIILFSILHSALFFFIVLVTIFIICLLSLSLNRVAEHCSLLLLDTVPSKQIHIQLIIIQSSLQNLKDKIMLTQFAAFGH